MMPRRPKRSVLPSVPGELKPNVRVFLESVREQVQTMQGQRGNKQDSVVTFRDIDGLSSKVDSAIARLDGIGSPPVYGEVPLVTGFRVEVEFMYCYIFFDVPDLNENYHSTYIYRRPVTILRDLDGSPSRDAGGNIIVDGSRPGFDESFRLSRVADSPVVDSPVRDKAYIYWAQHLGKNGKLGPISSTSGVLVYVPPLREYDQFVEYVDGLLESLDDRFAVLDEAKETLKGRFDIFEGEVKGIENLLVDPATGLVEQRINGFRGQLDTDDGTIAGAIAKANSLIIDPVDGVIATRMNQLKGTLDTPDGTLGGAIQKLEEVIVNPVTGVITQRLDSLTAGMDSPDGTIKGAIDNFEQVLVDPNTGVIATQLNELLGAIETPDGTIEGAIRTLRDLVIDPSTGNIRASLTSDLSAGVSTRVTDSLNARVGYCTIGGAPSGHATKELCEGAGGVWTPSPMSDAIRRVAVTAADGSQIDVQQIAQAFINENGQAMAVGAFLTNNQGLSTGFVTENDGTTGRFRILGNVFEVGLGEGPNYYPVLSLNTVLNEMEFRGRFILRDGRRISTAQDLTDIVAQTLDSSGVSGPSGAGWFIARVTAIDWATGSIDVFRGAAGRDPVAGDTLFQILTDGSDAQARIRNATNDGWSTAAFELHGDLLASGTVAARHLASDSLNSKTITGSKVQTDLPTITSRYRAVMQNEAGDDYIFWIGVGAPSNTNRGVLSVKKDGTTNVDTLIGEQLSGGVADIDFHSIGMNDPDKRILRLEIPSYHSDRILFCPGLGIKSSDGSTVTIKLEWFLNGVLQNNRRFNWIYDPTETTSFAHSIVLPKNTICVVELYAGVSAGRGIISDQDWGFQILKKNDSVTVIADPT